VSAEDGGPPASPEHGGPPASPEELLARAREAAAADPGDRALRAVAIASPATAPCWPCGACRQVLHEFGCREVVVEQDGVPRTVALAELLPHAFGPAALGR